MALLEKQGCNGKFWNKFRMPHHAWIWRIDYCQTPVLGLGLGVDFTFAWDNNNNNNNDNNDNDKNNPHLNKTKVESVKLEKTFEFEE